MNTEKFKDPFVTATNETRASVKLKSLQTLWFNTGTQCNLSCENCYIESNPKNDRLSFLSAEDVQLYIDEIREKDFPVSEIGLTGGEPFINPHIVEIVENCLSAGFPTLVLTNAVRIDRYKEAMLNWNQRFPGQLTLRVSLDHYSKEIHEKERGAGTFNRALESIQWMAAHSVRYAIAGRSLTGEDRGEVAQKYSEMLKAFNISVYPENTDSLVVFAEMDPRGEVPEITTACWDILGKSPDQMMCSSSRMVVKRKGEEHAKVLACTLIAYDPQFELGDSLEEAHKTVQLNHRFCAQFCVLGGSSCS